MNTTKSSLAANLSRADSPWEVVALISLSKLRPSTVKKVLAQANQVWPLVKAARKVS